jgi:serine phosphatase RsbU (regulator of sigma subunit)
MTPDEAYVLLADPECDPEEQSRMNPSFTCGDMLRVVTDGIVEIAQQHGERPLNSIMEKRVHQATQNQLLPVY